MDIIKSIVKRAKEVNATIILPEANLDERVKSAAEIILKKGISKIIVFGTKEDYSQAIIANKNCTIIDIKSYEKLDELTLQLYELRKAKGMTEEDAKKYIQKPEYFAMMLLKNGIGDGVVAGAKFSTADTLRPALQIIKTKKDKNIVTGNMLMVRKNYRPLVLGDVSLIEKPNSEQLSEIAISNAEFMEKIVGVEPRVAMLSYSTKGSAKGEMIDLVVNATKLAKEKSKYIIDGEMQADTAFDEETAVRKGISKEVGGKANVLIFPDLNAGNIGYKITARLGGFAAIGPIMLNFNKPVNDLSRGCTVEEIVNTVCITKLQVE